MANIQFTPEQQHAIDVRQGNILISAAAGSGNFHKDNLRVLRILVVFPDSMFLTLLPILRFLEFAIHFLLPNDS